MKHEVLPSKAGANTVSESACRELVRRLRKAGWSSLRAPDYSMGLDGWVCWDADSNKGKHHLCEEVWLTWQRFPAPSYRDTAQTVADAKALWQQCTSGKPANGKKLVWTVADEPKRRVIGFVCFEVGRIANIPLLLANRDSELIKQIATWRHKHAKQINQPWGSLR